MAAKKKTGNVDPNSLLSALTAGAKKKETGATKKKEECYLEGGEELRKAVEEYAASDIIAGIAEDQRKADGQHLKGLAFDHFVEAWIDKGAKPENPLITSQHASVRFQVKELYKPALPSDTELSPDAIAQNLIDQGVSDEIAENIATCLKVESNLVTKPLDKLLAEGSPAEKSAAESLMQLAMENLSEEQRGLLFETKPTLVVDAAKLSANLCGWCKDNVEIMKIVLGVLPPQMALSQSKHDSALAVASKRFEEALEAQ